MSDFQKLLEELEALQSTGMHKSLPADGVSDKDATGDGDDDDKAIAAAADGDDGHQEPDGDEFKDDLGEGATAPMTKSLVGADGEPVEVIDGTELVKSLMFRMDETEGSMSKALSMATGLIKSQVAALEVATARLEAQENMIKSLQDQVAAFGEIGRGRKATLSVAEKPDAGTMAKSEPSGMNPNEFMAKALTAQSAGRLTGLDIARAEACLNKGIAVPADIVNRVLS